jgi:hypothetical protein
MEVGQVSFLSGAVDITGLPSFCLSLVCTREGRKGSKLKAVNKNLTTKYTKKIINYKIHKILKKENQPKNTESEKDKLMNCMYSFSLIQ